MANGSQYFGAANFEDENLASFLLFSGGWGNPNKGQISQAVARTWAELVQNKIGSSYS